MRNLLDFVKEQMDANSASDDYVNSFYSEPKETSRKWVGGVSTSPKKSGIRSAGVYGYQGTPSYFDPSDMEEMNPKACGSESVGGNRKWINGVDRTQRAPRIKPGVWGYQYTPDDMSNLEH